MTPAPMFANTGEHEATIGPRLQANTKRTRNERPALTSEHTPGVYRRHRVFGRAQVASREKGRIPELTITPTFLIDSDITVIGSLASCLKLDLRTCRDLWSQASTRDVAALRRADEDARWEVLIGEDIVSLWYSDQRMGVIATPKTWAAR